MKQKFIEWFTKNNNGCSPAMEDDRSFVYEMTQHMFEAYQAGVAEGEARCAALAAENAGLKSVCEDRRTFIMNGVQLGYIQVPTVETDPALETIRVAVSPQEPTPATDAFLAEVRANARNELVDELEARFTELSKTSPVPELRSGAAGAAGFVSTFRKGVQS